MSKKISQAKEKIILAMVTAGTFLSVAHLWHIPSDDTDMYLLSFMLLYVLLGAISVWLVYALSGWAKILAGLNLIMTILVAGYDLFGLALHSSLWGGWL